jgi:HK97 family phage prohead protease
MTMKVRGYASIFGNVDKAGEVIDRGAFSNWIKANPSTPVDLYWQHEHDGGWNKSALPIGVTTTIKQDRTGLYYEAEINDTAKGLEVQAMLKTHGRTGSSIGFRTVDRYQKKEVWHLADLELGEITIAAAMLSANPMAFTEIIPDEGDSE